MAGQFTGTIHEPFLKTFFAGDRALQQMIASLEGFDRRKDPANPYSGSYTPEEEYAMSVPYQQAICNHLNSLRSQ